MSQLGHFRPKLRVRLPLDVCFSPKATYLLRGNENDAMGQTRTWTLLTSRQRKSRLKGASQFKN
jgi:hypothetical protein